MAPGVSRAEINVAQITTAVASVASAANAVAKFSGASSVQVAGVQSSIQVALGAVNSQQTVQNAAVAPSGSVAGVIGGVQPLRRSRKAYRGSRRPWGSWRSSIQLQALLGRASINVNNAGS